MSEEPGGTLAAFRVRKREFEMADFHVTLTCEIHGFAMSNPPPSVL